MVMLLSTENRLFDFERVRTDGDGAFCIPTFSTGLYTLKFELPSDDVRIWHTVKILPDLKPGSYEILRLGIRERTGLRLHLGSLPSLDPGPIPDPAKIHQWLNKVKFDVHLETVEGIRITCNERRLDWHRAFFRGFSETRVIGVVELRSGEVLKSPPIEILPGKIISYTFTP